MGIGNLNNNFGSLTAGGVNKTTNLKNTAKAETTVKNNVSFNADSLKSATLSDKEGVKFDSDNMKDNTEMLYAPKGRKKNLDSFTDFVHDQWTLIGGAENYTGKDAEWFGAGVFMVGSARWAIHKTIKFTKNVFNKLFG